VLRVFKFILKRGKLFGVNTKHRLAFLWPIAVLWASLSSAQDNTFRVDHTVEVATATHLFHVTTELKNVRQPQLDLALPAWTPGWYTIENYAKNILRMKFTDGEGRPLVYRLVRKQTWRIETNGARNVKVEFDYFANVLALNQAKIAADYAFFTGTQLFLEPVGHRNAPSTVRLKVPAGWQIVSALKETSDPMVFTAPDYDTLVDSPTQMGHFDVTRFQVAGKPHSFVSTPAGAFPQDKRERLAQLLTRIVEAERTVFNDLPYDKYIYFYFLAAAESNASGGLEHNNSHVVIGRQIDNPQPEAFVAVAAHEFFHVWNVKRLRPAEMFPYDYSREQESPSLWVSEGFTSYYSSLSTYRAGLDSKEEFLRSVGRAIAGVEQNPARNYVSPAEASTSTWLCYDTLCAFQISYYTQGQNLAALLDLSIRRDSEGAHDLDELMRTLYNDFFKRGRGFSDKDFEAATSRLAGRDYSNFFSRYVTGTDVPPYDEIFGYAGYRVEKTSNGIPSLGVAFNPSAGGLVATALAPDGEGSRAGMAIGDVLLKIDDAAPSDTGPGLANLLRGKIGQTVKLTIRREGAERVIESKVGVFELTNYRLVELPNPTPQQLRLREEWLRTMPR
jgi:predicted metalloprotease with PDZ domain